MRLLSWKSWVQIKDWSSSLSFYYFPFESFFLQLFHLSILSSTLPPFSSFYFPFPPYAKFVHCCNADKFTNKNIIITHMSFKLMNLSVSHLFFNITPCLQNNQTRVLSRGGLGGEGIFPFQCCLSPPPPPPPPPPLSDWQ